MNRVVRRQIIVSLINLLRSARMYAVIQLNHRIVLRLVLISVLGIRQVNIVLTTTINNKSILFFKNVLKK
jgi:hypothetical protein